MSFVSRTLILTTDRIYKIFTNRKFQRLFGPKVARFPNCCYCKFAQTRACFAATDLYKYALMDPTIKKSTGLPSYKISCKALSPVYQDFMFFHNILLFCIKNSVVRLIKRMCDLYLDTICGFLTSLLDFFLVKCYIHRKMTTIVFEQSQQEILRH